MHGTQDRASGGGKVLTVRLTAMSRESPDTLQGRVEAGRFRLDGELRIELWYDADGRWVKRRYRPDDHDAVIEFTRR